MLPSNAVVFTGTNGRLVGITGQPDASPSHSALGFDANLVIDGGSNALLTSEVSLGSLN